MPAYLLCSICIVMKKSFYKPEEAREYAKSQYKRLKSEGHISYTVRGLPDFVQKVKDYANLLRGNSK